jgi:hypothetical protein
VSCLGLAVAHEALGLVSKVAQHTTLALATLPLVGHALQAAHHTTTLLASITCGHIQQ